MSQYHEIMNKRHDKPRKAVSEPIQVYLDPAQRRRLDELADELGLTKSDVVRRGIEALDRQMTDPSEHPALRIIGLAASHSPSDAGYDVAREHDRFLADSEEKSWKSTAGARRGR
jgi:hypothetical protein